MFLALDVWRLSAIVSAYLCALKFLCKQHTLTSEQDRSHTTIAHTVLDLYSWKRYPYNSALRLSTQQARCSTRWTYGTRLYLVLGNRPMTGVKILTLQLASQYWFVKLTRSLAIRT